VIFANLGFGWMAFEMNKIDTMLKADRMAKEAA
jgi:hypothetical protein